MKLRYKALVIAVASAAVGAPFMTAVSATPFDVGQDVSSLPPVTFNVTIGEDDCSNHPGSFDYLGTMTSGPLSVIATFKNNWKGTHTVVTVGQASVDITPTGGTPLVIPKQPVLGGPGGNPYVGFQFATPDPDQNNPAAGDVEVGGVYYTLQGDYHYLGRCVQGLAVSNLVGTFPIKHHLRGQGRSTTCSNKASIIDLNAGDVFGEGDGILFLSNQLNKVDNGNHLDLATASAALNLTQDLSVFKNGKPVGPGGNPLIDLQFAHEVAEGTPNAIELNGVWYLLDGADLPLGRCVQLA